MAVAFAKQNLLHAGRIIIPEHCNYGWFNFCSGECVFNNRTV